MTKDRTREASDRQLYRIKYEAAKLDAERLIESKFREARESAAWNRIVDDIAGGRTPRELVEHPSAPKIGDRAPPPSPVRWHHVLAGGLVGGGAILALKWMLG